MKSRSVYRARTDHRAVAEKAKAARGEWVLAGIYPTSSGGRRAAGSIERARHMPSYSPPGTFEAYSAQHEDGGTAVWTRYVAGAPAVEPRPSSMRYRVCDPGTGPGYQGVKIITVTVAPECPRCGGPRGKATPHRFVKDGDWYVVDQWSNACGHLDTYSAVLAEYRKRAALLEEAERRAELRAAKAGPVSAGEYAEAVRLLTTAASEMRGLHAKQAAQYLDMRGQTEAARRIQEEMRARHGHMSGRQAAKFLVELAAAREACDQCEDGRIDYRARDGEFVSLRCRTCRRDVIPSA
ncbi:hypothetical protein ACFWH1_18820 [Streptomyces sp. NPDC127037]|uniref:hypothetical protein n=1 Tax=Streptomyces sp. NPDC127037 TaxID=3347113 RepID=UPI003662839D